jgi:hypothetical protein
VVGAARPFSRHQSEGSVVANVEHLRDLSDRLRQRQPLRFLIGHTLHDAAEIIPSRGWSNHIRETLVSDVEAQLLDLTSFDLQAIERSAESLEPGSVEPFEPEGAQR